MRVWMPMLLAALLMLAGCGAGTKEELMRKLEQAKTGDEVRRLLGKPGKYDASDMPLIGKVETLTYVASDGEVTVVLHNNKVVTTTTGGKKDK